jgi:hypothetical protein
MCPGIRKCRGTMKTSTKKANHNLQPAIEYGFIDSRDDGSFMVSTEFGIMKAVRALSCLVSPEVGDMVLVSADDAGSCYILSILERTRGSQGNAELSFEGNVNFNVRKCSFSFTSEDALSLSSPHFELNAHQATVRIEKTSFFGKFVENNIEKLRLVAESVDSIIKRTVQRLTSSYRYVEEHDEIRSASTRMIVDGTLTMHTKNTMHIAEGHVKIDAGQIHLG